MKLAPALLVPDRIELEEKLALARQMSDRVQIDVVDGVFADNRTVQLDELTSMADLRVDLDLMVARPSQLVAAATRLQPHLVILHVECAEGPEPALHKLKTAGTKIGLALNPDTAVNTIQPWLSGLSQVLIMGVPAGFAGQRFAPEVLTKVAQIRQLQPAIEIGLDGGVNGANVATIAAAGVDIAYVNSAVFEHPDPVGQFKSLAGAVV